jgi:hypothetical protein
MSDCSRTRPSSTPASVQSELRLSDLVTAASTFSSSDPGPDRYFDEDPIPEIAPSH